MIAFENAFAATVGEEGVLSLDPRDRGNWTSGRVGVGELLGTKYGISCAAHPDLDIRNLTLEGARAIYLARYWRPARCGELPPFFAAALFDAAVNHGVSGAVEMLQRALDLFDDGAFGPRTMAAALRAHARSPDELLDLFHAERLLGMADAATWPIHGRGWCRRVLRRHRQLAGAEAGGA